MIHVNHCKSSGRPVALVLSRSRMLVIFRHHFTEVFTCHNLRDEWNQFVALKVTVALFQFYHFAWSSVTFYAMFSWWPRPPKSEGGSGGLTWRRVYIWEQFWKAPFGYDGAWLCGGDCAIGRSLKSDELAAPWRRHPPIMTRRLFEQSSVGGLMITDGCKPPSLFPSRSDSTAMRDLLRMVFFQRYVISRHWPLAAWSRCDMDAAGYGGVVGI